MESRARLFTASGRGLKRRISNPAMHRVSRNIDVDKLLHFSQQLYAHALTLQEVIRNQGEVTYQVLRPGCDRQAAEQFKVFQRTLDGRPEEAERISQQF